MSWQQWIGKPHRTGADPVVDDGCDCLIMVTRVRQQLKLPAPSNDEICTLIALSEAGAFEEVNRLIAKHLILRNTPSDGSFTVYETPDHIGSAVMIDGGLLHVSHKRGVRWIPTNMLRKFDWYDWK